MTKKWWNKSVVYQIYPRSFNDTTGNGVGDLKGITKKLDYLATLGIDLIWICPIYKSPMKDNGYDISDYTSIDPLFGTMEDMDKLLKEANNRGIKILMDLVVNHTSTEHMWFKEARKSKNNKYRDFYIWRDEPNDMKSVFGGSAWEYDETTKQYYFHYFAKEQADLNWENPEVAKEIHKMMNWWLEKGVGGFRFDVIDLIGKEIDKKIMDNGPNLHKLLQEINAETFGNKNVVTVGETWGATPKEAIMFSSEDRNELSMVFQFEHMTLDWGDLGKWTPIPLDLLKLKSVFKKWQTELKGKGWNSLFLGNHDLPRIVSRWGNDTTYRVKSAKMLAMMLHMQQGTPYIYQGEEIGMTNVKFEDLKDYNDVEIHNSYKDFVTDTKQISHDDFMKGVYKMGRDNARTPMQWNTNENAGFSKAKETWLKLNPNYKNINVEESLNDNNSIFYTYKKLIDLRKNSEYSDTIVYGDYKSFFEDNENIIAYKRFDENYCLEIICNFSDKELDIEYSLKDKKCLLNNYDEIKFNDNMIHLKAYQAIIILA